MRLRPFVLLAVAVSLLAPLEALEPNRTLTQYVHRIWQVQQGLPDASIYSILQTRDGYLWLGTQTGVVRFDGVRFRTLEDIYKSAPADIWIRGMAQAPDGALWIGTNESGVYRLDAGAVMHYTQANGMPSDTIQCVVAAGNDIWACTTAGLVRFADGKIQVFHRADGLSSEVVRAAAVGPDGKLWAGGERSEEHTSELQS